VNTSEVLILGSDELSGAVPLELVVDAVEESYRLIGLGRLSQQPRLRIEHQDARTGLNLLAALAESTGLAAAHVYSSGNRGAPVAQKVTLVFNLVDGGLRALIESDWLSWARTGATGAVAARFLARADSTILGLIGTGKQAEAQLLALASSRHLSGVYVFSRDRENRDAFARRMTQRTAISVEALTSADDVVARSDIVATVTTSSVPVFNAPALRPGQHINAMGAHAIDRREIDSAALVRSRVFVDSLARSTIEDGELAIAAKELAGAMPKAVELSDILVGKAVGRIADDDITLFLSGGMGAEYLEVAAAVVSWAEAAGIGTRISMQRSAQTLITD
jgi:ornithine cyclodeaminase/alanine dehydrogenase-like protein (mu-crystallin family)